MKLSQYDILDITDIFLKIEKTFEVKFDDNEFEDVTNFGQIIDRATENISSNHDSSCTSQQAFYKLKSAFKDELNIDILPNDRLDNLIPKRNRRKTIDKLSINLNFDPKILKPEPWVTNSLGSLLILSIIIFFWKSYGIGVSLFIVTLLGFQISFKYANYFNVTTVKDLVKKMTKENYIKVKRDKNSINKTEVEKIITDFFVDQLGLEKGSLTRATPV